MEQENEQEWIGGRNPVLEVLRSDRDIHKIYVQEGSQKGVLKQVLTLAKERKIQVQFVPKQKIEKVVSGAHQGVAAQVAAYQYAELDDLFVTLKRKMKCHFSLFWMN